MSLVNTRTTASAVVCVCGRFCSFGAAGVPGAGLCFFSSRFCQAVHMGAARSVLALGVLLR